MEEEKKIPDTQEKSETELAPIVRDVHGRFAPGHSGNPLGGPRKKTFRDYFSDEEEADMIERVKTVLKKRPEILKMAVEHLFGKPRQNIGLDGGEGKPIIVNISKEIADKNGINNPNPEASGDSKGQAQV